MEVRIINTLDGYSKFQIGFHIFIVIIACGIIISYILNNFQVGYMIIGSLIAVNSIYQLYKLAKTIKSTNENAN